MAGAGLVTFPTAVDVAEGTGSMVLVLQIVLVVAFQLGYGTVNDVAVGIA